MIDETAATLVAILAARGETVATAESLTGGLVAAAITDVAGSSAVLRGGVVSYATDLKASLLGVPTALLDRYGPVHPGVAEAMAAGVRRLCGADWGLATTGVAGPGPADGHPAGTAYVAVRGPAGSEVVPLALGEIGRADVRAACVREVLALLARLLAGEHPAVPDG